MKGIVLAGGTGSRLYPLTEFVGKQLLPVYDKPMIYYPISTLMLAGIKDVMIISTPQDCPVIERALGDGSIWGISISYCIQESPDGIAQAFILAEDFINGDNCVLVLGDNIFYGHGLPELLDNAASRKAGATVFGYCVSDPERFGVVEFDHSGRVLSLEEKPQSPRSNFAVTGLYFYDNSVCDVAKDLRPSNRGELEITDLNLHYLRSASLHCEVLGRGYAWLDAGTHDSLLESSSFVAALQKRQGLLVCSPEEIAFRKKWISAEDLASVARGLDKTSYGEYLLRLATEA